MVFTVLLASQLVWAGEAYLAEGKPDGLAILPPPPAADSPEQKADLASARLVFNGRSAAEEARAFHDATLAFSLWERAIGSSFRLDKLPKTEALLQKVKKETGPVIDHPKNHWKRSRPYANDPALTLGAPERSYSYPSGHSTRGTLYSLVLAEIFPEKREAILQVGQEIGWDRVLIGKHFPTDILAGRFLGKAIMNELLASPEFQKDVAAARAEVKQVTEVTSN